MSGWITHLAGEPESWNIDDDGDDGMPGAELFGNAVQAWAAYQGRPVTVTEAAGTFNVAPELIRQSRPSRGLTAVVGDKLEVAASPGRVNLGNALQVWSSAQSGAAPVKSTVGDAALAFNLRPERIREAVEGHYWIYLAGDVIEHEGE